jgi:ketosteroid isomerase-like protein
MKKLFMVLPLVFLLCITFSCQKGEEGIADSLQMSDEERALIAASAEQALSDYVEAIKQMDWNRMFEFLVDGDELVFAEDGMLKSGKDTLVGNLKEKTGAIKKINSLEHPQKHVYVLSKDAAVITVEFDQSITLVTDDIVRQRGSWIYVFHRINNEWEIVHTGGTRVPVTE